jgi:hypothetical protein
VAAGAAEAAAAAAAGPEAEAEAAAFREVEAEAEACRSPAGQIVSSASQIMRGLFERLPLSRPALPPSAIGCGGAGQRTASAEALLTTMGPAYRHLVVGLALEAEKRATPKVEAEERATPKVEEEKAIPTVEAGEVAATVEPLSASPQVSGGLGLA